MQSVPSALPVGPRFGVIVVNLDGGEMLLQAIRSALNAGVPVTQVVLVDNGSADDSAAVAEAAFPGIIVIRNGCNVGFARAVNPGLAQLQTEFVLLLNNDAEIDPDCLRAFAAEFDTHPRAGMLGGQLRYPNGKLQSAFAALPTLMEEIVPMNFLKWAQPDRYRRVMEGTASRAVESVFGACLAVRSDAIQDTGGMDEDFFFYFEEVEWCRRIQLHGWTLRYVPGARALHVLGHTAKRYRSEARIEMQRSKLLYFRKVYGGLTYAVLSIFLVFRSGVNAFFGLLACLGTLFLKPKLRQNTAAYGRILLWHVLGRPSEWGLPGCREGRG